MTKYFPKDDIIALAGQIVPEGYELREIKQEWIPNDKTGVKAYVAGIVFGFEGKFYQFAYWNGGDAPAGFLSDWDDVDVPACEVFYTKDYFWREAVNEN